MRVPRPRLLWRGCMHCRYQAFSVDALAAHFVKEHLDKTVAGPDRAPKKDSNSRWECSLCPERFITPEGLEHHSDKEHQKKGLFDKYPPRTGWKDRTSRGPDDI